jgi:hypothetical protein
VKVDRSGPSCCWPDTAQLALILAEPFAYLQQHSRVQAGRWARQSLCKAEYKVKGRNKLQAHRYARYLACKGNSMQGQPHNGASWCAAARHACVPQHEYSTCCGRPQAVEPVLLPLCLPLLHLCLQLCCISLLLFLFLHLHQYTSTGHGAC